MESWGRRKIKNGAKTFLLLDRKILEWGEKT